MEINYDKDADALYIQLGKGTFSKNKKLNDYTILDLDKDGNILGIELLDARKRMPDSLNEVHVKNLTIV